MIAHTVKDILRPDIAPRGGKIDQDDAGIEVVVVRIHTDAVDAAHKIQNARMGRRGEGFTLQIDSPIEDGEG